MATQELDAEQLAKHLSDKATYFGIGTSLKRHQLVSAADSAMESAQRVLSLPY